MTDALLGIDRAELKERRNPGVGDTWLWRGNGIDALVVIVAEKEHGSYAIRPVESKQAIEGWAYGRAYFPEDAPRMSMPK